MLGEGVGSRKPRQPPAVEKNTGEVKGRQLGGEWTSPPGCGAVAGWTWGRSRVLEDSGRETDRLLFHRKSSLISDRPVSFPGFSATQPSASDSPGGGEQAFFQTKAWRRNRRKNSASLSGHLNAGSPQGEGLIKPKTLGHSRPLFTEKWQEDSTKPAWESGESTSCQTSILEIECLIHRVNYKRLLLQVTAMSLKLFFNWGKVFFFFDLWRKCLLLAMTKKRSSLSLCCVKNLFFFIEKAPQWFITVIKAWNSFEVKLLSYSTFTTETLKFKKKK